MALKLVTLFLVISFFMAIWPSSAREVPEQLLGDQTISKLTYRLETNGSVLDCWNALTEVKSCSNEIVIFFTNGTTDIGPECCQAITVITHNCWPTILTALGFTSDQTYVLRGYCDASSSPSSSFGPAQGPSA